METPRVLVTYASRAGGTHGIARVIATELRVGGVVVDLDPVDRAPDPVGYDAVVLGSAVYFGSWEPAALRFAEGYRDALGSRPLWLFSSGPLDPERVQAPADPPRDLDALARTLGARQHRVFGGILSPTPPGIVARYLAAAGFAGDYRDLAGVRAWARGIGAELSRPAGCVEESIG